MAEPSQERYLAVDLEVLSAVRELAWIKQIDPHVLRQLRVILRVVHIEPATGNVIIGAQLVRDLEPPGEHFGTI
jgi:hypothetical protein